MKYILLLKSDIQSDKVNEKPFCSGFNVETVAYKNVKFNVWVSLNFVLLTFVLYYLLEYDCSFICQPSTVKFLKLILGTPSRG